MSIRRLSGAAIVAAALFVVTAATAWACVSGPAVALDTETVKAGGTVQIKGSSFRQPEPVVVRFNALDGPVLAELGAPKGGLLEGSVTVPADVRAGNYVLVFTQTTSDGQPSQVPARALITVTGESGTTPVLGAPVASTSGERLDRLATAEASVGGGTMALIGVGVGGIALFVAGVFAFASARRDGPGVRSEVRS